MFVVQEIAFGAGDEKLAAIRVFAAVGHRQKSRRIVLQCKILICKCAIVHAIDASPIALYLERELNQLIIL